MLCKQCKKSLPSFAQALKKEYCSQECEDKSLKDLTDSMGGVGDVFSQIFKQQ